MDDPYGSSTCKWPFYRPKSEGGDLYAWTAPGQETKDSVSCEPMASKLERGLYGLVLSPVMRDDTINAEIMTVGFTPT